MHPWYPDNNTRQKIMKQEEKAEITPVIKNDLTNPKKEYKELTKASY